MARIIKVGINTLLSSFSGIKSLKRNGNGDGNATIRTLYGNKANKACMLINMAAKIARNYPVPYELRMDEVKTMGLFYGWARHDFIGYDAPNKDKLHAVIKMIREKKEWFEDNGIILDEGYGGYATNTEIACAAMSAFFASKEFGIEDKYMLNDIAYLHGGFRPEDYYTLRPEMKAVMLAGLITGTKARYGSLAEDVARYDIDLAMLTGLIGKVDNEGFGMDEANETNRRLADLIIKLDNDLREKGIMTNDDRLKKGSISMKSVLNSEEKRAIEFINRTKNKIKARQRRYYSAIEQKAKMYNKFISKLCEKNITIEKNYGCFVREIGKNLIGGYLAVIDKAKKLNCWTEDIDNSILLTLFMLGRGEEVFEYLKAMENDLDREKRLFDNIKASSTLPPLMKLREYNKIVEMNGKYKAAALIEMTSIKINETKTLANKDNILVKGQIRVNCEEIIKNCNIAIGLLGKGDPLFGRAFYNIGVANRLKGDNNDAIYWLKAALEVNPSLEKDVDKQIDLAEGRGSDKFDPSNN